MAATLDEVSAGRLVLGLGARWHDPEYEAFGFPTGHRVSRFAEALEIVARLLRRERVSFEGRYYRLSEAELLPAPKRAIPILVAGEKTTNAPVDGTLGRRLEHGVVRGAERQAARRNGGARAGARRHRAAAELQRTLGIIIGNDPADTIARRLDTWAKLGFDHVVAEVEPIRPNRSSGLDQACVCSAAPEMTASTSSRLLHQLRRAPRGSAAAAAPCWTAAR